jgi:MFS family permease
MVVPPIMLPVFLAAADGTVVATALPAIAAAFGNVDYLAWIVIGNLVASTGVWPTWRCLRPAALTIFMVASCLCAIAPSFWMLLAARVLQGLGSGGLMTLAQALIGEHVPPRQRGTYQGYLSANIVAGTTIGPVTGGFITQAFGWHAVFLAYLPLGVVAMLLLMRLPAGIPGTRRDGFDLFGMVLLTGFVVPLLLTVSQLQKLNIAALPGLGALLALTAAGLAALLCRAYGSSAAPPRHCWRFH